MASGESLTGIILDLRNNPGGILPAAIGVSAAFLPSDVAVVSTKGRLPDANVTFYSRREFYAVRTAGDPLARLPDAIKKVKMVVLVNTRSASASEIVAAALQDHGRARIIGRRTPGIGTVQTIRMIDANSALKLTSARLGRPNGESIDAVGIRPDVSLEAQVEIISQFGAENDTELAQALKALGSEPTRFPQ